MLYYTLKGDINNLKEFLNREEIRGKDINEDSIDAFTEYIISVTQWDKHSNNLYASGEGTETDDHAVELLIPGTYFSIKLSAVMIEILKALFRLTQLTEFKGKFMNIVELGYGIYTSAVRRLDNKTYCIYNKLLRLAYNHRQLTLPISDVKESLMVGSCDTDLPKYDECFYEERKEGKCNLTEEKLIHTLYQLERQGQIVVTVDSVRIIL